MSERQSDNSNSDDLLSAYQDGELSAEERGRLEAELRASPEKQEVLRQYSQLSSWLKDLPRGESSADLRAEVMRKIQAPAATPGVKRSSRLFWQLGVSLSSVAALVLVMWFAAMPKAEKGPQLAQNNTDGVSGPQAGTSKMNLGMDVAKNESSTGMFSTQNNLKKEDLADKNVAGKKVEPGIELGAPAEFPFGPSNKLARKDDPRSYQYSFEQDIAQLQPGQVVRALEHAGDKVSVVTLSVVDRQEALNSLRVVLAKQAVSDEAAAMPALKEVQKQGRVGGDAKEKSTAAGRDLTEQDFPLIAVYVQATGGQLEAAIKELKSQEQQFLSLNVESAIPGPEVEELVEENDRPLVAKDQRSPTAEDKKGAPAAEASPARPAPAPALKPSDRSPSDSDIDPRRPSEGNRAKSLQRLFQLGVKDGKLPEALSTKSADPSSQQSRQRAVQLKRLPSQMDQKEEGLTKSAPAQQQWQMNAKARDLENRDRYAKPEKSAPAAPAIEQEKRESKPEGKSELAAKESPEQPLKVLILLRQKTPHEAPISVPGGQKK